MEEIIDLLESKNITYDRSLLEKSFKLAEREAKGKVTVNNIDVIKHVIEVTKIIVNLDVDTDLIYAAILHETLKENKKENYEYIKKEISEDVAEIVEDVKQELGVDEDEHEEKKNNDLDNQ